MHHQNICIPSIKSQMQPPPAHKPSEDDQFPLGDSLESVYPLLNIIFTYLDLEDLKVASNVSPTWKDMASMELSRRNTLAWISYYAGPNKFGLEYSRNFLRTNVGCGIIIYNPYRLKLKTYVCLHAKSQINRMTVAEYFSREVMPRDTSYCLIGSRCFEPYFDRALYPSEGRSTLFDGILLPQIPNIRVSMFYCSPHKPKTLEDIIPRFINEDEQVKAILIFSVESLRSSLHNFLEHIVTSDDCQLLPICGGVVKGSKVYRKEGPAQNICLKRDLLSIAFLQNKDVDSQFSAMSHVIDPLVTNAEEVERSFRQLKEKIIMRTQSVAFLVSCTAKCKDLKNIETDVFRKMFPDTPMLTLEADGEIGWNSYYTQEQKNKYEPSTSESKRKKRKRWFAEATLEWSTTLLILTWGDIINKKDDK